MDPNLFHLDWERTFEALVTIVIMAFLIERALALLFETRIFIKIAQGKSFKELIAFAVAAIICIQWEFDAISMILLSERVTIFGSIVTGAIIAGGSKASIKLFKDIMGFMSTAESERISEKKKNKQEGVGKIEGN